MLGPLTRSLSQDKPDVLLMTTSVFSDVEATPFEPCSFMCGWIDARAAQVEPLPLESPLGPMYYR